MCPLSQIFLSVPLMALPLCCPLAASQHVVFRKCPGAAEPSPINMNKSIISAPLPKNNTERLADYKVYSSKFPDCDAIQIANMK